MTAAGGPTAIGERLAVVQGAIAAACARSGRRPEEVTLVAVSKTRPAAEIAAAVAAGQRHFGENRVQEAEEKFAAGPAAGIVLHLIGHLQANKARSAVGLFACIHSVDSVDLLLRLDRLAAARPPGRSPLLVLAQVKLAAESTKHGLPEAELPELLEAARGLGHVQLAGLMCLPPFAEDAEQTRPYFRRLRQLRDAHGGAARLPQLSMGMSHDYPVAVEEGATLVRVGEAIFGPRPGQ